MSCSRCTKRTDESTICIAVKEDSRMERIGKGEEAAVPLTPETGEVASGRTVGGNTDAERCGNLAGPEDNSARPVLANVYRHPERHTVTLLLDDETAESVIFAVRALTSVRYLRKD
jgi:hypothetical protein